MRPFDSTFWLVVPKDKDTNRRIADFCATLTGDRAEESVRCSNGANVSLLSGWRLDHFRSEVKPILRSYPASEIRVFRCAEGAKDGVEWRRNILKRLPRSARYSKPPRRKPKARAAP